MGDQGKKFRVRFLPDEVEVEVGEGSSIAEAANKADIHINNLCGGEGVCGRCRVQVTGGNAPAEEHAVAFFSEEELEKGFVLACQTAVEDNLEVTIPSESRLDESQIMTGGEDRDVVEGEYIPLVRKIYMELSPPTLEDNIADIERVSRHLRRNLGWHSYETSLGCIQNLSELLRDNDWKVTATVAKNRQNYKILAVEPLDTTERNYGLAVDVGTTTVVAQLVDIHNRKAVGVAGAMNSQARYGEDVISRMIYACGKGGLSPLHKAVVKNINQLIEKVTSQAGVSPEDIQAVAASGNTTMSHFLLNLTPCSIRVEPYVPTADVYPQILAEDIGIKIHPGGILETIPSVASYVGGDIVSGLMSCGIAEQEEVRGLIDIGTNGEIAIGNNEWLVCCSASAGPAFEGGGTRCGMRATTGAIEKVEIRDGDVKWHTIGGKRPRGLCGSGLIDSVYELVTNGIIGPEGKFHKNRKDPRLRLQDDVPQYVICTADETETGEDIVITESDIDHLMKSKGAVFAAIKSLTDYIGLTFDQIEAFYVAGGFGNYLDIHKAVAIGLLPDIDQEKILFIGNSSLTGARMCLLSEAAMEKCFNISRSMTNIELSNHQPFMDEYIAALFLPHTERKLFPSVKY